MENTATQAFEELVAEQKKKRNRVLSIIIALFTAIIVFFACLALFKYNSGNISGTWRNSQAEQDIVETSIKELQNQLPGIDKTWIDATYTMTVVDKKAVFTATTSFDIPKIAKLTLDQAYKVMLEEAQKEASSLGISVEEYLTTALGADYEKQLKSFLPTQAEAEKEFHKYQDEYAKELGATYNQETGTISATFFEGEVDQLFHTVTITKINDAAINQLTTYDIAVKDIISYSRKGNTTIINGNEEFTLEK
ncbi:hypothetical protein [Streptococcus suis]|uniref:hypothetical protein n=1 Tax=Streptococcus suis TaxID=1307 RepID=UPI00200378BB|nr:hypothetical protein [Streptococcus suis]HEL2053801.1 hypothetical protein [Streptococcus suis]HEL2054715.1 hypothetical protein [Streptococcus suis]HEM3526150.1 hypothetical protein [Streptococcus suis]HEM5982344.1 hypothetical protein [Streptococcus suis]